MGKMRSAVVPCCLTAPLRRVVTVTGGAAGGIDLVGDDGADGAEGVEAFAAGPLAVGLLDVAGGDVVDDDVAANVGADVFVGAELAAAAADDDAEFALVVDALWRGRA